MALPSACSGFSNGDTSPNAMTMPANDRHDADPLQPREALAGQEPARRDDHEDRRGVEIDHRAAGRCVEQALIDQDVFDREQKPDQDARLQRAVAKVELDAARKHPDREQQCRAGGADRHLHDRRHVRQRELDRDLVEAPAQAEDHRQRDRQQIERAGVRVGRGPGRRLHLDRRIESSPVVSDGSASLMGCATCAVVPTCSFQSLIGVAATLSRPVEVIEPRGVLAARRAEAILQIVGRRRLIVERRAHGDGAAAQLRKRECGR